MVFIVIYQVSFQILVHYFNFFLLFNAIIHHLYISLILKINSTLEITDLTQYDCFIVSKIDWINYFLAVVASMFVFIF